MNEVSQRLNPNIAEHQEVKQSIVDAAASQSTISLLNTLNR
ncbi:MAG: hypothetical protein PUH39_05820 [Bacteroidales bacterium]|nr:hypothetical protein [Bacteroidales bacterium]